MDNTFITDPNHGGKISCHKCSGFITETDMPIQFHDTLGWVWFHTRCYNPYDHYYGLDKPLD